MPKKTDNLEGRWTCGKCDQISGRLAVADKLPKHSPRCPVRKIEEEFDKVWFDGIYTYDRDVADGVNPYWRCTKSVKDFFSKKIVDLIAEERKRAVAEAGEWLLSHGHGGGNFRRLIFQKLIIPNDTPRD